MNESEVWRRVRTTYDDKMSPVSHSSTSPISCKIRALAIWPGRTLVPVIFIPGIMGSNLKSNGKKAWVPPNGIIEGLGEAFSRSGQKPKDRQRQLTADDCDVYEHNEAVKLKDSYLALDKKEAERRHWGELHAASYLPILKELEEQLNYPFANPEHDDHPPPQPPWKGALHPKADGLWTPKTPLTEDEFRKQMGRIYFPVYACGYNWLKSNDVAAQRVIDRIAEIEKRIEGNDYYSYSGKVILVTHSMGGLVGRRAAQLAPDKILGVVHGVQPVTGAPVVYRRFKSGTEANGFFDIAGIGAAVVLGWDAADTTCVLGNSPGPMELLPTRHYGSGWLRIADGKGNEFRLPQGDPAAILEGRMEADPYTGIYEVSALDKWWGMVDPGLLDPAGKMKNMKIPPHKYFLDQLDLARNFHNKIGLTCHPHTYAHYGDDPKQESFASVTWETSGDLTGISAEDLLNAPRKSAKLTGKTEVEIGGTTYTFKLKGRDGPGDGTVPTPSGEAAKRLENVREVFGLTGFDHQFSYNHEVAQHTVLYAIGKLVQQITLKEDGTCERH